MKQKKSKSVYSKFVFSLPKLSGSQLIYKSDQVFSHFIDHCFFEQGMTKAGIATPKIKVMVYEIIRPTTFLKVFEELPGSWDEKWLSQHQVVEFCKLFPQALPPVDSFALFLCKKNENQSINQQDPQQNLAIAMVEQTSIPGQDQGLSVLFLELQDFDVWFSPAKIRIIVPEYFS